MIYRLVVPFTDLRSATDLLQELRSAGWEALIVGPEGEEYHPRSLRLVKEGENTTTDTHSVHVKHL